MTKPTVPVSIIAANYNNGVFLEAFINSVINSSLLPEEIIIVDDGSTDNSIKILNAYSHLPYLRTILFETNQGFTSAINAALQAAASKYVMRADPDDLLHPQRIGKQFDYLEQNPETDMLGSNAVYFDSETEKPINKSNFPLSHHDIINAYRKGEHGLLHATVCGKRSVYQKYRYQQFSPGEDYELFSRMVKDGHRFANLDEALYKVRVHPSSSTSTLGREGIVRTFQFRDQIFGTRTTKLRIWFYYNYIRNYRNYQLSGNNIIKYFYLFLAILSYPSKLLKRLIG
jgi:glycosyltransferase involved in cell wall biosynthesis